MVRKLITGSDKSNDTDTWESLKEISTAVRRYVRTGETTELLENFLSRRDGIFSYSRACDDAKGKIRAAISDACRKIPLRKKTADRLAEDILDSIGPVLKDMEYLGCMDILCESYYKERSLRWRQERYRDLAGHWPDLPVITGLLRENRRMDTEALAQELGKDEKDVRWMAEYFSQVFPQLFNLREKKDGSAVVSLYYWGRDFDGYINCGDEAQPGDRN